MRRFFRIVDLAAALGILWIAASAMPLTWFWYNPGPVIVSNAKVGESPKIGFTREIYRPVFMRYSVLVRNAQIAVVCEASSAGHGYDPNATLPDDIDLGWWAAPNPDCATLKEPGSYFLDTCWKAPQRLFGLLADRAVCVRSNVFEVTE